MAVDSPWLITIALGADIATIAAMVVAVIALRHTLGQERTRLEARIVKLETMIAPIWRHVILKP